MAVTIRTGRSAARRANFPSDARRDRLDFFLAAFSVPRGIVDLTKVMPRYTLAGRNLEF